MGVSNFNARNWLYRIVDAGFQLVDCGLLHPYRERSLRALQTTVDFIDQQMPNAVACNNQKDVLKYALSELSVKGSVLEFGVFTGGTIRFLAARLSQHCIHGFDSFEGLPETWTGSTFRKFSFARGGALPKVPRNVTLHKGWFSQTIPEWLAADPNAIALLHVDCDIYSSASEVLEGLAARFVPGTIIVFDEYFNYPNWVQHEYRAWQECVTRHNFSFEYLAYARNQVALKIT